jgi:hypothetical protein
MMTLERGFWVLMRNDVETVALQAKFAQVMGNLDKFFDVEQSTAVASAQIVISTAPVSNSNSNQSKNPCVMCECKHCGSQFANPNAKKCTPCDKVHFNMKFCPDCGKLLV